MRSAHPLNGHPWDELHHFRIKDGYSISGLARAAGIRPQFLSMLERGERNPSPKTIAALADVLNIPKSVLEPRPRPSNNDTPEADTTGVAA